MNGTREFVMVNVVTHKPLVVRGIESGYGSIPVPSTQLDDLCRVLDAGSVPYWVNSIAISFDGQPEQSYVILSRKADLKAVQRLLDGTP